MIDENEMSTQVVQLYARVISAYNKNEYVDTEELEQALIYLDKEYTKGNKTPLSDEEYDKLHSIYIDLTGKEITGDVSSGNKVKHDYPDLKGTVAKVHYITSKEKRNDPNVMKSYKVLEEWIVSTFHATSRHIKFLGFYPKFDGMSVVLSLDENRKVTKAVTRGDMDEGVGQDKTELFQHLVFKDVIPPEFDGMKAGLKIEAIVTHDDFKEYNKKCCGGLLADERAAAASLLNSKEFTEVHQKYLSFTPLMYEVNGVMGFYHIGDHDYGSEKINYGPLYELLLPEDKPLPLNLSEVLENLIAEAKKEIDKLTVNCDGIVVRWTDGESVKELGRNESRSINNFEVAYKFPKQNNYTKITDIIQDIGVLGAVSYTAEFEPFNFNGRTIKHASLGSYDRAKALNLAVGDMVNVKYEIIPYLLVDAYCELNRSGNKPIKLIDTCPYCHTKLNMDPLPHCDNMECESRLMGKILNFCEGMRIKNIGESMIEDLFHAGYIHDIQDLFSIESNKDKIKQLDGFGDGKLKNIIHQIKHLSVPDYRLLGSIGIPNVRAKRAKSILDIYYIHDVLEMSKDPSANRSKLLQIKGVGNKFVDVFLEGIDRNRELIEFLLKHVKVTHEESNRDVTGYVVFTGFRNPDFEKFLEKGGIVVQSNVNKDTTLVIAKNPDAKSKKIEEAVSRGIDVISVEEAYVKLGYKY